MTGGGRGGGGGLRGAAIRAALLAALVLLGWEALDRAPGPDAAPSAEDPDATRVRIEQGIDAVRARFHEMERRALAAAESAVPEVFAAVPHPGGTPEERAALFEALRRALGPEGEGGAAGAALVDPEGAALAWWGRAFIGRRQGPPLRERHTRVLDLNVYRVLLAEVPLSGPGGDSLGAVRVYEPFQAKFSLDNRYIRRIDFEADVEAALGLEKVDIEFGAPSEDDEPPGDPARTGRVPLAGVLGHTLGTLAVTVRPLATVVEGERARRSGIRRGILAALAVAAALAAPVGFLRGRAARGLARAALLVGARAVLLVLGMPRGLLPGDPFDPTAFEVRGWAGALGSPGDALLTAAAILGAVAALSRALPRPRPALRASWRVLALLAAGAVAAVAIAAGIEFHALVASKAQVDLFPEDRVLPPAAAAALQVAAGCIAAAGFVAGLRLLAIAIARPAWPASLTGRAILLTIASSALAHLGLQWQSLEALRRDALAAADRLDANRDWEERAGVSAIAARLARPGGVAEKTLRGRGPRTEDAAFSAWAKSPDLNGRPDGCSLDILDAEGHVVSRFEIDLPPRSWLPEPLPVPAEGVSADRRRGRKGAQGRPFVLAAAPIRDASGLRTGGVRVTVPAGPSPGVAAARPEILRNYGGSRPPPTTRALHRAVFDGARLRESTHPYYPRGMPAPREAVEAILREGEPVVWIREEVAGGLYHNAYMPRIEEDRATGILSVGFPALGWGRVYLNMARVFFLHVLVVAGIGVLFAAAAAARGRLRVPPWGFRAKLLAGFVLVGAVPVVSLAFLEKSLAEERAREAMEREVLEGLRVVEASLRDAGVLDDLAALGGPGSGPVAAEEAEAKIPDERVREIAHRAGVPVNLFLDDRLLASSERGIFATELFSPRLSSEATRQVLLLGRGAFAARERFGTFPFLVGYAPVRGAGGEPVGVLSVPLLFRQDRADRDLAHATTAAVAMYLLVLLVVAGAGAVLAQRVARPVEALVEGTRRVAGGDLSTRIPKGPRDELGALVDSFNRMTEGLEAGREAEARAQREAAWREMAKQVAHEIKNPLTPMRLHAQHLLRAQADGAKDIGDTTRKTAEVVLRQTDALQRIASDFAAFARLPRRNPERLDLGAMAREAADLYRGSETVEVILEAAPDLPAVVADREEMRLVLVNLCGNAIEAMPGGGRMWIRARAEAGPPAAVVLEVEDTGVGIPPGDIPRLFDPSFSTKTRGTGLGLAIVRRAMEDAGGTVSVRSEPGKGSLFAVRLPAA